MWRAGACPARVYFFFFQAEDGIRDKLVTGVQTCALPISRRGAGVRARGDLARVPRFLEAVPGRGIGRASWRERGEISVVAVSLKKKNKKNRKQDEAIYESVYKA